jgi:hypothetical protein
MEERYKKKEKKNIGNVYKIQHYCRKPIPADFTVGVSLTINIYVKFH